VASQNLISDFLTRRMKTATAILLFVLPLGCAQKQHAPPVFSVKNAYVEAPAMIKVGQSLPIKGHFEVESTVTNAGFVVQLKIVEQRTDGTKLTVASENLDRITTVGSKTTYEAVLSGPRRAGTYHVDAFAGSQSAGTARFVVESQ